MRLPIPCKSCGKVASAKKNADFICTGCGVKNTAAEVTAAAEEAEREATRQVKTPCRHCGKKSLMPEGADFLCPGCHTVHTATEVSARNAAARARAAAERKKAAELASRMIRTTAPANPYRPGGGIAIAPLRVREDPSRMRMKDSGKTPDLYAEPTAGELFSMALALEGRERYREAIELYEKAARLEYPEAFNHLAYLCEVGLGCFKDLKRAEEFYILAAQMGNAAAEKHLERLYRTHKKVFGMGKGLSFLLHLPGWIFGGIFSVAAVFVKYFLLPLILMALPWLGLEAFFTAIGVPAWIFAGCGALWGLIAIVALVVDFKDVFSSYRMKGVEVFERGVLFTFHCSIFLVIEACALLILGALLFALLQFVQGSGYLSNELTLYGVMAIVGLICVLWVTRKVQALCSFIGDKISTGVGEYY